MLEVDLQKNTIIAAMDVSPHGVCNFEHVLDVDLQKKVSASESLPHGLANFEHDPSLAIFNAN